MRDTVLPKMGVKLEDKEGQPPVIKLVDSETLMKELEEKEKVCSQSDWFKFDEKNEEMVLRFFNNTVTEKTCIDVVSQVNFDTSVCST